MPPKIIIAGKEPGKLNVNMPAKGFINIDKDAVKKIPVENIVTEEPFKSLFKMKAEVLEAISENMIENGYDVNLPVIIWKERNVLIDGHTRLQAAKNAGIESIPAFYASFEDEEQVIEYMHRLQFNRRNINDGDLIRLAINALPKFDKIYGQGSKAEFLAKRFTGLSEGKAKQVIIVAEKGDVTYFQKIAAGEMTIRQAYHILKEQKEEGNGKKVTRNFFEDDGEQNIIRCDEKGVFYLRDYEKKKELKIFSLAKCINSPRIRDRIRQVIEEEMGGREE